MDKKTSKDIQVGAKFGRWTILEINTKNPKSKAARPPRVALCQCECGTKRYKEYRDLYSGRSQSCGCRAREQIIQMNYNKGIIEEGTRFGYLTFVKDLGYRKQQCRDKKERWSLCQCDCGNFIEVSNNNLKSGGTTSCGCVKSRGERIIGELLRKNNINFSTQYTFSDLRSDKNTLLRFDFAIFINNQLYELIEFDGRQHFQGPDATWKNSDSLETIQRRDNLKNEYCKNHNIKLVRIPYTQINNINLKTLELDNIDRF